MQYVMFNLENSTKNAYALTFPFFRFPYEESVSESLIFGEKYNQTSKIIQSKCGICKHDVAVSKNDDCYCCYYDVMMTQLWEE